MHEALRSWAEAAARSRPELMRVGYVGSYARGDWGPGSDVDVVLVLESSGQPRLERGRAWDLTGLPVPADVLVYTSQEVDDITRSGTRFGQVLGNEAVWVYRRDGQP